MKLKRILAFAVALICAAPAATGFIDYDNVCIIAEAEQVDSESNFKFRIDSDTEQNKFAVVTGYDGSESTITVPSVVIDENGDEYTVKFIECGCFKNNTTLEKVTIPNTVIGFNTDTYYTSEAFYGCTSLKEVVFEENSKLEIIGMSLFSGCTSLETIAIPDSVNTIYESAFKDCSALKEINLNNIKTIQAYAFDGCKSFESITLYEGLETIGDFAFLNCPSMKSVTVPESVTEIGKLAFGATSRFSWTTGTGVAYDPIDGFVVNGYENSEAQAYVERTGKLTFNAISGSVSGDIDGDGQITSADALGVLQMVVSSEALTDEQKKIADLDGDGNVTSADALYILQMVVGLR